MLASLRLSQGQGEGHRIFLLSFGQLYCFGWWLEGPVGAVGIPLGPADEILSCMFPLVLVILCKFHGHLPSMAPYSGSAASCGIHLLHALGNRHPGDHLFCPTWLCPCALLHGTFSCSGAALRPPTGVVSAPFLSLFSYCGKIYINKIFPF